ncbi:hypothetical protein KC238_25810 [Mycobacteroides chelonae]|uniref:hypothetical protein n=1 Tax=Mycobacteroides chelonae TaxID=1774 RepID=UPI001C2CC58C|nr:hypothetical protein [Mycobacteroides chelonae]MBV0920677.1 hypothetical protein [Mycobacteroides chelonae]
MNSTIVTTVHYAGQEIQVDYVDAQLVIDAMDAVNRGVSQCVMLSNGWKLVIGPGIPVALHTLQEDADTGPSLQNAPSAGPAPVPGPSRDW